MYNTILQHGFEMHNFFKTFTKPL